MLILSWKGCSLGLPFPLMQKYFIGGTITDTGIVPGMEEQRNIVNRLKEWGIREKYKLIVGGAPVTHQWASGIGADGYSDDAVGAVALVDGLIE